MFFSARWKIEIPASSWVHVFLKKDFSSAGLQVDIHDQFLDLVKAMKQSVTGLCHLRMVL